uniref:Uncharacterized protein n=1 Tax=viral metagenome TaxID=1070528 RepID=A0A6C0BBP3_9ZZZZ
MALARGKNSLFSTDLLARKYEISKNSIPSDDDPNFMEKYNRQALKYAGPDRPLTEAEEVKPINNKYFLSLRETGGRSTATPFRPDEYYEDTTRDPRQNANNDPCAENLSNQKRARNRYILKTSDESHTIHEAVKTAREQINQRVGIFGRSKKAMPWFYNSDLNKLYKYPGHRNTSDDISNRKNVLQDQKYIQLGDKLILKPDFTTRVVSDTLPLGWYMATDQEMGVMKYGRNPIGYDRNLNVNYNQHKSQNDEVKKKEFALARTNRTVLCDIKRATCEHTQLESDNSRIAENAQVRTCGLVGSRPEVLNKENTEYDQDVINSIVIATKKNVIGTDKDKLRGYVIGSERKTREGIVTSVRKTCKKFHTGGNPELSIIKVVSPEYKTLNYSAPEVRELSVKQNTIVAPSRDITREQGVGKCAKKVLRDRDSYSGDVKMFEYDSGKTRVGHMEKVVHTRRLMERGDRITPDAITAHRR